MAYTVTYSKKVKGWPSFYSYLPERMVGMNNKFYSFKDGNLFEHNSSSASRGSFYGNTYNSEITAVVNDSPTDIKTFKNIALNSNSGSWDVYISTNEAKGGKISSSEWSKKEGKYYSYIKNLSPFNHVNGDERSVNGLGINNGVEPGDGADIFTISFPFDVGSIIASGDEVWFLNNSNEPFRSGYVVSKTKDTVTILNQAVHDDDDVIVPPESVYIYFYKNQRAESYGVTGYYMKYHMISNSTGLSELFGIDTEFFKSFV